MAGEKSKLHGEQRPSPLLMEPHSVSIDQALSQLKTSHHGLSQLEASSRLTRFGPNTLPRQSPPSLATIFLRQFKSPLIYVLVFAAIISIGIREFLDAGFITAVLFINAVIGTIQEFSAQRAAAALQELVTLSCRVLREGDSYEIDAAELVPGDTVLLEAGDRIPADLRLLSSHDLAVDESLLTGESAAVLKEPKQVIAVDAMLGERLNMSFAGSLVSRGRAIGLVVSTGPDTELGHIADIVLSNPPSRAPLLIRMETFTHRVALLVGIAALLMASVTLLRGMSLSDVLLSAVALAVSAIPEGLPVALTVALAVGMQRMARRNVIVRRLIAMEALGSCTCIASDKTGTLTLNQLMVRIIQPASASDTEWSVTGEGAIPEGAIVTPKGTPSAEETAWLEQLCTCAVLTNEGFLGHRDQGWTHHGDAVDVALLVMAHKAGINKAETSNRYPECNSIPFESQYLFSASLNDTEQGAKVFVKGALERLLPMCQWMSNPRETQPIDHEMLESKANTLAAQGYRILALACGEVNEASESEFTEEHLQGLTLLGLVGMLDPLRTEAKAAVTACQQAGVKVMMVTGDHPTTALAIARELELSSNPSEVVTGHQLKHAESEFNFDQLVAQAKVFARVDPEQKLDIVQSLQRSGHFVAVSGDGANDAPALRVAQVGVAMGQSGTDVARETADLIITDDNFASIVAGVEEGRVAFANVRKVIFLLISTGAAEIVLFLLALISGLPLPLLAVQLLWLNLVTNGIQDVALAFEPREGDELSRPPRSPNESIFNRLMVERVVISAIVIGSVAFMLFQWLLQQGYSVEAARNGTLFLMVLFENIHVFNCRSETRSTFRHNPLRNPLLLLGTLTAQLVHIGALYTPWLNEILGVQPISLSHWVQLLSLALSVLVAMELHKLWLRWRNSNSG